MTDESDPFVKLIATQFSAAIGKQETALTNHAEKDDLRHSAIEKDITQLEKSRDDHETRIRSIETSTTQFRFLVALSTGGGFLGFITLIRELIQ